MSQPTWTEQQISEVAEALSRRAPIKEVAAEFGLSRSAFYARVTRHKELHRLIRQYGQPARMSAPRKPSAPRPLPPPVVEPYRPVVPLPLPDLHGGQCHFPVDEDRGVVGGFLFCAAATGSITERYCEKHKARMRQRPREAV